MSAAVRLGLWKLVARAQVAAPLRRLAGTQRAALRLALGMARRGILEAPGWSPWASDMAAILDVLRHGDVNMAAWDAVAKRHWRARLALYLRALLRVDRNDFGPLWYCRCTARGASGQPKGVLALQRCSWCGSTGPNRILPLWEVCGPKRYTVAPGVTWRPEVAVDRRGWRTTGRWVRA